MKKFEYFRIVLYILGIIFLVFVATGGVNIPCFWKENYNIICPSCGITRATKNLVTLNFKEAYKFHPLYVCILFPFSLFLILNDIYTIIKRKITRKADISYIEIVCGYVNK